MWTKQVNNMLRAIRILFNKLRKDAKESKESPKTAPSTVTMSPQVTPTPQMDGKTRGFEKKEE